MRVWLSLCALLVLFVLGNILILAVHPSRQLYLSLPILVVAAGVAYAVSAYYRDLDVEDRKIDTIRTLLWLLRDDLRGTLRAELDFRDIDQGRFATRAAGSLFAPVRETWYQQDWLKLRGSLGGRLPFALEVGARMSRQTISNPRSLQRVVTLHEQVRLTLHSETPLAGLDQQRLPQGLFARWTECWATDRTLVLCGETAPRIEYRRHGLRELVGRDALVDFEQLLALVGLGLAAIRQLGSR